MMENGRNVCAVQIAVATESDLLFCQVRLREELRRVVDLMQQEVAQFGIVRFRMAAESIH